MVMMMSNGNGVPLQGHTDPERFFVASFSLLCFASTQTVTISDVRTWNFEFMRNKNTEGCPRTGEDTQRSGASMLASCSSLALSGASSASEGVSCADSELRLRLRGGLFCFCFCFFPGIAGCGGGTHETPSSMSSLLLANHSLLSSFVG